MAEEQDERAAHRQLELARAGRVADLEEALEKMVEALQAVRATDDHADPKVRAMVRAALRLALKVML